ncbi:MAG: uroporphyrinogen-III C-methyltransferase [Candidatus Dadabacteria bacterium]|nr:MAG: uroporphyrinogen-III C-methyltransferase [Candidatus Dadabacteria bacterium]
MERKGFVYLVGAGPGDPGLVTLRARQVLGRAEAVVYDNLVHPRVLDWAPPEAERVPMGKIGHVHQHTQAEINQALIDRARAGKLVVRLKGGDPAVFGRLGEEAEALAREGIPFEVVPGVTSASAAAVYAGFPLTHRDHAPSVTFVTGHRRRDGGAGPELDWGALARASGTLVVYMGIRTLPQVVEHLVAGGRDPATPVAVVERASWPGQRVVTGTLADIVARARAEGVRAPALVIVGGVVELRSRCDWLRWKPLFGKRVLVTRAAHQCAEFSELLRDHGAEAVELPLIELRPTGHASGTEATLRRLFAYDWVILTSGNAVRFLFERLDALGLDARAFGAARVCAVGPRTAEALEARGIRPDVVPGKYVAEALVEALATQTELRGASVLVPRAKEARDVIPNELTRLGAKVEVLPIYENVKPATHPAEGLAAVKEGALDLVTLASSSAARNYAELCRELGVPADRIPCAVIGPATEKTARALGLPVAVVPEEYTLRGLVAAAERYFLGLGG